MKAKTLTPNKAIGLLLLHEGEEVKILFRKKNGEVRKMRCNVEGIKNRNTITVFDCEKDGYRSFNIDRLLAVLVDGKFYKVKKD